MGPWIKLKVAQENEKSDHWSLRELFIGQIYAAFCARGLPVGVSVHSNGVVLCSPKFVSPTRFTALRIHKCLTYANLGSLP